jgi:hypothetical protein
MSWVIRIVFIVVLAVGLLCLNYTNGAGAEHHREWAAEHDLPPPSQQIFYGGAGATVVSAMLLGLSLGRRTKV